MDFFDMSKDFKRVYLGRPPIDGCIQTEDFTPVENVENRNRGHDYVKQFQNIEKEDDLDISDEIKSSFANLEFTTAGTTPNIHELQSDVVQTVYREYYEHKSKPNSKLIINDYKKKILSLVEANEVTILTGPTGCGKTTQVPQFILDSYIENNKYCNIVVTQPRRIAAISIAKRVCEERGWITGSLCGYKVGLKSCISDDTLLAYVTVDVLLKSLIMKRNFHHYTHIILDEIHERDQSTDFLLILIKKLLKHSSNNIKVVLMSATVQAMEFAKYFEKTYMGEPQCAPIISINHSTNYAVQIHYLEELAPLGELPLEENFRKNAHISPLLVDICVRLIKQFDKIDNDVYTKNSVLVFLPGLLDIENLYAKLTDPKIYSTGETSYKWTPLPLHSSITTEEQARIFQPSPNGYRKIILATNIAESSITVPGVKFVIDFCLTKNMSTGSSNFQTLELCWASQANCIQRAGRVGRVMEGRVYRMVYKSFYQSLPKDSLPEILRAPLDKIILNTKMLDMGEPRAILAMALDPPDLTNIESTILNLKEVGGLLRTTKGVLTPFDGDLTYLGRLMALLPVDVHVTRLIMMGHLFGCLEECIIMGACMSLKSVFNNPFNDKYRAYNSKLAWANGSLSDCIAFLHVYDIWSSNHRTGYFKRSAGDSEEKWAKRHFIQLRVLREVKLLIEELKERLKENGIEEPVGTGKVQWSGYQKAVILKIAMAGAFYPNYFGRGIQEGKMNEEMAVKKVGGRNPFTTVYLTNFPREQPIELYSQLIKDAISENNEDMKVTSDGSSKVYVEFRKEDMMLQKTEDIPFDGTLPGRIPMGVYRAVKMRSVKRCIEIKLLPVEEAKKRAAALGIKTCLDFLREENVWDSSKKMISTSIPSVTVTCLQLIISYTVDPGNFWAYDVSGGEKQADIFNALNDSSRNLPRFEKTPAVGEMCIAPFDENGEKCFYRARVTGVRNEAVQVFFIDYGNPAVVNKRDLRRYTPELEKQLNNIPGLAFECVLCELRPSLVMNPKGSWSEEACSVFDGLTKYSQLFGTIYSVVNGVVSLELFKVDEITGKQISINKYLIDKGFAEKCEENYLSKKDHEARTEKSLDTEDCSYVYNVENYFWDGKSIEPPPFQDRTITAQLHGPYSPMEMKVYPYVRSARDKVIHIHDASVNCVLLDSDPQDPHERLVIAAVVSENSEGTTLMLNNTTIMPGIRGLGALIPFIFAPEIELRVNKEQSRYTGMLCGLGADENGRALYPEHDMEVLFDCVMTDDDFDTVNSLRYYMSLLLMTEKGDTFPNLGYSDVIKYQRKIQSSLVKLLETKRKSKEKEFGRYNYKWKLVESDVPVSKLMKKHDQLSIFPFHRRVSLKTHD